MTVGQKMHDNNLAGKALPELTIAQPESSIGQIQEFISKKMICFTPEDRTDIDTVLQTVNSVMDSCKHTLKCLDGPTNKKFIKQFIYLK